MSCFFFNDTATTEIYTLSLHDALPISDGVCRGRQVDDHAPLSARTRRRTTGVVGRQALPCVPSGAGAKAGDRKSTRLNSSHANISYAVFCLKKKKHLCTQFSTTSSTPP